MAALVPINCPQTNKGLPRYRDAEDSDVFSLAGAEDFMPVLSQTESTEWTATQVERLVEQKRFTISIYGPRVEGLFSWGE
jgi:hypothetical protein